MAESVLARIKADSAIYLTNLEINIIMPTNRKKIHVAILASLIGRDGIPRSSADSFKKEENRINDMRKIMNQKNISQSELFANSMNDDTHKFPITPRTIPRIQSSASFLLIAFRILYALAKN